MRYRFITFWWGAGSSPPPAYAPSLDFSDARNSQHYIMGWWI